ncbi:hypothetical protein SAMN03097699_2341 [Flavobacteriaceae bacterium MAR_2010_188]|nr:hypothetical protein SAMN03097699_2341 [Flavobacteriaceae bacterium MAR_2010_188]
MINHLLRSISYILHPILMPFFGVVFYFAKSPRFIPEELIKAKLISLGILTIVLPILLYSLLRTLKKVNDYNLETTQERRIPLLLNCLIILLVILRVMTVNEIPELYYFFVGILISNLVCLILAYVNFKASIHMIGAAGFFMFAVAISINFQINVNPTIAIMSVLIGAIATSRLHMKAHSGLELIVGFCIGFIPQLIVLNYWL